MIKNINEIKVGDYVYNIVSKQISHIKQVNKVSFDVYDDSRWSKVDRVKINDNWLYRKCTEEEIVRFQNSRISFKEEIKSMKDDVKEIIDNMKHLHNTHYLKFDDEKLVNEVEELFERLLESEDE